MCCTAPTAQSTADNKEVSECLLQSCWSFTNLLFLKSQEAKRVNIGTAAQELLAGSQTWSRRQGLCRCLPVKGASVWLQHLESLIWDEGSGMQPQACSPGKDHTRNKPGQTWELWKMIHTITGTAWVTLCFSMALACIPLHLREVPCQSQHTVTLSLMEVLSQAVLQRWWVSLYIWNQATACATTNRNSWVVFFSLLVLQLALHCEHFPVYESKAS